MFLLDSCGLKKSIPLLIIAAVIAQIDLASAAAWPMSFLAILHLTPVSNDTARGLAAGLGCSIDVLVLYQFLRIVARRMRVSDAAAAARR